MSILKQLSRSDRDYLAELLEEIKRNAVHLMGGPGICALLITELRGGREIDVLRGEHVRVSSKRVEMLVGEIAQSWPHCSENPLYPVPAAEGSTLNPERAYNQRNKWDANTDYGRLRRDLLDHLIEVLGHDR